MIWMIIYDNDKYKGLDKLSNRIAVSVYFDKALSRGLLAGHQVYAWKFTLTFNIIL